jgi:hypothetical protein
MTGRSIEALAQEIAAREVGRQEARRRAQDLAHRLHARAREALDRFGRAVREAGAPHLDLVGLDPVEPDDKSVRAFQFRIHRGAFTALVVCRDRGEMMLVGPFKRGHAEEPCHALSLDQGEGALEEAIDGLMTALIEQSYAR